MKFGVRAHDFGKYDAKILAEKIRENGFEAVHLAVKKSLPGMTGNIDVKQENIEYIRDAFCGMEISVLGSYIDFTTDDEDVWEKHRDEFVAALKISKPLGALYVGSESSYGEVDMENKVRLFPKLLKRLDDVLNEADKYDAYVAMEPVASHTLYNAECTAKMLNTLSSERLKIIFDPLNVLTKERVDSQEALWKECIDAFGKETKIIHLKDGVFPDKGRHVACKLGEGIMRYDIIKDWIKKEKTDISVIREEERAEYAKEDLAFMKNIFR